MRWLKSASKNLEQKYAHDLEMSHKKSMKCLANLGGRYNIWYNLLGRTIGKSDPQTDVPKNWKTKRGSPDAISPLAFIIKTIDAIDWGLRFLARERFGGDANSERFFCCFLYMGRWSDSSCCSRNKHGRTTQFSVLDILDSCKWWQKTP